MKLKKLGKNFLKRTPKAQEIVPGINKFDYMELKFPNCVPGILAHTFNPNTLEVGSAL